MTFRAHAWVRLVMGAGHSKTQPDFNSTVARALIGAFCEPRHFDAGWLRQADHIGHVTAPQLQALIVLGWWDFSP